MTISDTKSGRGTGIDLEGGILYVYKSVANSRATLEMRKYMTHDIVDDFTNRDVTRH